MPRCDGAKNAVVSMRARLLGGALHLAAALCHAAMFAGSIGSRARRSAVATSRGAHERVGNMTARSKSTFVRIAAAVALFTVASCASYVIPADGARTDALSAADASADVARDALIDEAFAFDVPPPLDARADASDALDIVSADAGDAIDACLRNPDHLPPRDPACGAGTWTCTGRCVNLAADPSNCGACGIRCCLGFCAAGMCIGEGPAGFTLCSAPCSSTCAGNGIVVNLQTDTVHCGSCGISCPAGNACVTGICMSR